MRDQNTREKILRSAIRLISEKGYEAVTVRMIAQGAGCQASSIYHHFSSKEEILSAIRDYIQQSFALLRLLPDQVEELLQRESAAEILRRYFMSYRTIPHELRMQLIRFMYMELYDNEMIREMAYYLLLSEAERHLVRLLETLAECNAIPPADFEVLAFVWLRCASTFGISGAQYYMERENQSYTEMLEFFIQCVVRGVRPAQEVAASFTTSCKIPPFRSYLDAARSTKDRLVAAAFLLMHEFGGDKVTIRMICDVVGIQSGSAYNHFKSKDDILHAVTEFVFQQEELFVLERDSLLQAFRCADRERMVLALARSNPQLLDEDQRDGYRVIFREHFRNPYLKERFWGKLHRDRSTLVQVLTELVREGAIPSCDVEKIATMYLFTMAGINTSATMFEQELEAIQEHRQQAGLWVLGLILHGQGG